MTPEHIIKKRGFEKGYTPWNKGKSLVKLGKNVPCKICGKMIYRTPAVLNKFRNSFCSMKCLSVYTAPIIKIKMKGKIVSEKTKNKLRKYTGEKSSGWKGGISKKNCKDCGKKITHEATYCDRCKCNHWTKEHREKISKKTSLTLTGKMPKNILRPGKFGNILRGYFDINGKNMFFRSKWEANYSLYLDFLVNKNNIKSWSYESRVFIFEKIKLGTRSYRPDFEIINNDGSVEYHEVKGWMTPKSKTQLRRMKIYYPEIKVTLVDSVFYRDLSNKLGKLLKFY